MMRMLFSHTSWLVRCCCTAGLVASLGAFAVARGAEPTAAGRGAGSPASSAGASRAAELVQQLASGFRVLRAYDVVFALQAGEYAVQGRYAVEGPRYRLEVGDAEVFADAATRYEVDRKRREVTVLEVDTASRNLLNNPARAFDFLGGDYRAELLSEREGRAVVRLTPIEGRDAGPGTVTVELALPAARPMRLTYEYEGERVVVAIRSVTPRTEPLPAFDPAQYAGYEFIDFR